FFVVSRSPAQTIWRNILAKSSSSRERLRSALPAQFSGSKRIDWNQHLEIFPSGLALLVRSLESSIGKACSNPRALAPESTPSSATGRAMKLRRRSWKLSKRSRDPSQPAARYQCPDSPRAGQLDRSYHRCPLWPEEPCPGASPVDRNSRRGSRLRSKKGLGDGEDRSASDSVERADCRRRQFRANPAGLRRDRYVLDPEGKPH